MADAFLFRIAAEILNKLGSAALDEIGLVWGFKGELSKLKDPVSTIEAELLDAQKRQVKDPRVKNWLEKLGYVFDDADNLLDELSTEYLPLQVMTRNKRAKKVRIFFSIRNQLAFRVKMAHKIKSIREKLDAIAKDRIQFNFIPQQVSIIPQVQVMGELDRETHGSVIKEEIIGRNDDKQQIIKLLSDPNNHEHVSIIPIVGIGGIGKTTLAQLVFNDESFVKPFEPRMWVYVDVFNVKLVAEKMIESATSKKSDSRQLEGVRGELQKIINGKKYLLVLDDMWDDCFHGWPDLSSLLMGGALGSKVLVTTRSDEVAKITGTLHPYPLGNLLEEDAWSLFKKLAFKEDDELTNSWKLEVGRDIVKKCAQVPLAIKTIGRLLFIKDGKQDWLNFRDIDLVNIDQKEEKVKIMEILRLSYNHLPLHLRPCFAYCSLFPKDSDICKEKLIQLWIAQGFVKSDGNQNLEDIGESYFNELLRWSFFQEPIKKELYNIKNEWDNITHYKMHDLIHDLAEHVAWTEYSSVDSSGRKNFTERTLHVSCKLSSFAVKSQKDDGKKMIYTAKKLRTFLGPCVHNRELKKICSTFKRLRVLGVQGVQMDRVWGVRRVKMDRDPDCMHKLHKLKHLRYLDLQCKLTKLPKTITRLPNLQSLILSSCGLESFSSDIDTLVNLRYLDLSGNNNLTNMSSLITRLRNLQTLKLERCGLVRLPEDIGELASLRHLYLSGNYKLTNLPSSIIRLRDLQTLKLESCGLVRLPEDIGELASLTHLYLSHNLELSNLPSSIGGLQNLSNLLLWGCRCLKELPEDIGELASLSHLDLSENSELSNLPSSIGRLRNLRTLFLSHCLGLKELPREISQLVSLRHLVNNDCRNLTDMGRGLGQLTGLRTLKEFVVGEEQEGENCAGIRLSELKGLNNLEGELRIERLERVSHAVIEQVILNCEEVAVPPPNTSTHLLKDKQHLKSLDLSWLTGCIDAEDAEDADRLLEGLQPHPNLERLRIHGAGVNLASWIGQLTSLRSLEIIRCERLACLSAGFQNLTALRRLEFYNCKELDLSNEYHRMQFQGLSSLVYLRIVGMPKLASLPVGLKHVTTLQSLIIYRCDNLMTLPDWIDNFTSLQSLTIGHCPNLMSLPEAVCRLRALQELDISSCPQLIENCENLRRITTLRRLTIEECDNLITLPDWIFNFTSLRVLWILDCPKLTSMPEAVRRLGALQELLIMGCPQLEQRCQKETGQDWPNIAHIPRIAI